jgi:guanosine-diphosphatase
MSTGVDNPPHKSKPDDLDSISRHRSFSRSNGFAPSQSIDPGRISGKQPAKMAQTQRTRYVKTGAIIAFVFMVLLWLSPSKSAVSSFTHGMYFLVRHGSTIN